MLPAGVVKPVLITMDDAQADQLAWDPLLQTYGFKAAMFVITGFVDNLTPGHPTPAEVLTWAQLQALALNGRWEMAFHAGLYGNGDGVPDIPGSLGAFGRLFRLEVQTETTLAQFSAALSDTAFAR